MKSIVWLLGFVAMATGALGQNCTHTNLSKSFIFQTKASRFKQADSLSDSCVVTIRIIGTQTRRPVQTITYSSINFFPTVFQQCNSTRSYLTGKSKAADAPDNDYGDFIVADFNFDGKEDFATKNDSGGNGGPTYRYYTQNSNGLFSLDNYLTDTVSYFPVKFSESHKTLTTLVHANAYQMSETTYQFHSETNEWRQIRNRLLP